MVLALTVQGYTMSHIERQIERNAIDAYVQHGVKVVLPLSARARRELGRIRRSIAGLRELHAVAQLVQMPFESSSAYTTRTLQVATDARAAG